MKRTVRFPAIFVCFLLMAAFVFPVRAFAAGSAIDTSTSSDGYFTVAYLVCQVIESIWIKQKTLLE